MYLLQSVIVIRRKSWLLFQFKSLLGKYSQFCVLHGSPWHDLSCQCCQAFKKIIFQNTAPNSPQAFFTASVGNILKNISNYLQYCCPYLHQTFNVATGAGHRENPGACCQCYQPFKIRFQITSIPFFRICTKLGSWLLGHFIETLRARNAP